MTDFSNLVRVKRDGGRGFRWIDRANFDPKKHVDLDAPPPKPAQPPAPPPQPAPKPAAGQAQTRK